MTAPFLNRHTAAVGLSCRAPGGIGRITAVGAGSRFFAVVKVAQRVPMVEEEVPPYAGGELIKPGSLRFGRFRPGTAGMPKRLSNAVLPHGFPRRMPGICALKPPRAQEKVPPRCMPERNLLFLVADRGAAGRVSGGIPVISLVRFLL